MDITERKWLAVPARTFTANGTVYGVVTIPSTLNLSVKQRVWIRQFPLPPLSLEIKRVTSETTLELGLPGQNIDQRENLSIYLNGTATLDSDDQARPSISLQELNRAVYMEEPLMAIRTYTVDPFGNPYTLTNPMPVAATFDGEVKVGDIRITAVDDDPVAGDLHSSVRISNGVNEATVNPDGSFNVVVQNTGGGVAPKNIYSEAAAVVSGVDTLLSTYTVPPTLSAVLERIVVSGENIAKYSILLNGSTIDIVRTYFGGALNATFDFSSPTGKGMALVSGDVVQVKVLHTRPFVGDFNSRIQAVEM